MIYLAKIQNNNTVDHGDNIRVLKKNNSSNTFLCGMLINLVLISTFASGIVFELIGLAAFVLLFIVSCNVRVNNRQRRIYNKNNNFFICAVAILCVFLLFQFIFNGFNLEQIIKLRGITRCTFAVLLVWFCIRKTFVFNIGIHTVLPMLIIMNILQIIYIYSGITVFNVFQGSWNYLGAVDLVLFPFVLRFDRKSGIIQRFLFVGLTFFVVLFMGSRSLLLMMLLIFAALLILEKNKKLRKRYILIGCLFLCFMVGLLLTDNSAIERALSVFEGGYVDLYREKILMTAKEDFYSRSFLLKLFGTGNYEVTLAETQPVHNFVWELLLTYGYLGFSLWIVFHAVLIIKLLRSKNLYRHYIIAFFLLSLILNYVQPFLTGGFLYQFTLSYCCLSLYYSKHISVRRVDK